MKAVSAHVADQNTFSVVPNMTGMKKYTQKMTMISGLPRISSMYSRQGMRNTRLADERPTPTTSPMKKLTEMAMTAISSE
ncbi:hypothetical protein DSECCO2_619110 [anaerobic digester metagenome]